MRLDSALPSQNSILSFGGVGCVANVSFKEDVQVASGPCIGTISSSGRNMVALIFYF